MKASEQSLAFLLTVLYIDFYHVWIDEDGLHYDASPLQDLSVDARQVSQNIERHKEVLAALVRAGLIYPTTLVQRFGLRFFSLPREEMLARLAAVAFSIPEKERQAIATLRRWRMGGRIDATFALLPASMKRDTSVEKYRRLVDEALTTAPCDEEVGANARAWICARVDEVESKIGHGSRKYGDGSATDGPG